MLSLYPWTFPIAYSDSQLKYKRMEKEERYDTLNHLKHSGYYYVQAPHDLAFQKLCIYLLANTANLRLALPLFPI